MPLQVPPEQGHGPGGVWVAKILRTFAQEFEELFTLRLVEQGGPPGAVAVCQGGGVAVTGVGGQPVVDGPRSHPQSARD